jgi:putative dehydrogenase
MSDHLAGGVGVVGIGEMGLGMAQSLDRVGLLAAVADVRDDVFTEHSAMAVRRAPTPAAVAERCTVVFVVVDAPQVEMVLFGDDGIASAVVDNDVVACVCATVDADAVRDWAARAVARGFAVVDVGIAGGATAAHAGELLTMVGCDDDVFAAIEPALAALSCEAIHAGPVGAGMELKLVKNGMSFTVMAAVHEAMLLGEELGFSAELLARVVDKSGLVRDFVWFPLGRPSARPLPAGAPARAFNEHYARLAAKDLGAVARVADRVGVAHPVIDQARALSRRYFLLDGE